MTRSPSQPQTARKPKASRRRTTAADWGIDPANPQADLEATRATLATAVNAENQVRSYTVKQTAELLNCHPNTVLKLITNKQLPSFKVGAMHRVRHVDLMAFIQPAA